MRELSRPALGCVIEAPPAIKRVPYKRKPLPSNSTAKVALFFAMMVCAAVPHEDCCLMQLLETFSNDITSDDNPEDSGYCRQHPVGERGPDLVDDFGEAGSSDVSTHASDGDARSDGEDTADDSLDGDQSEWEGVPDLPNGGPDPFVNVDEDAFVLVSQNTTSAVKYEWHLFGFYAHLLCLQETRLYGHAGAAWARRARQAGWSALLGQQAPPYTRKNTISASTCSIQGGLAALTDGVAAIRIPVPQELRFGHRLMVMKVALPSVPGLQLLVVQLYGHANSDSPSVAEREALLQAAFDIAAEWGSGPAVIVGDLNTHREKSPTLDSALATGHWSDLHLVSAARHGHTLTNTCRRTSACEPTRIDFVLGNRAATAALLHCDAYRTLCPTHAALRATFGWRILGEYGWALAPTVNIAATRSQREQLELRGPLVADDRWNRTLADGGKAAILLWSCEAEHMLQKAAAYPLQPPLKAPVRCRGKMKQKRRAPHQAPLGRQGSTRGSLATDSTTSRQRLRQLRRLDDLSVQLRRHQDDSWTRSQGLHLWQVVLQAQGFGKRFDQLLGEAGFDVCPQRLPTIEAAAVIRAYARQLEDKLYNVKKNAREKRSREAFWGSWVYDGKDKWMWIRSPSVAPPTALQGPSGDICSSVKDMDAMIRNVWLPIWQRHGEGQSWSEASARLLRRLPRNILKLRPLCGTALRKALMRMRVNASLGSDVWAVNELRSLPDWCLQRLAEALAAVEAAEEGGESRWLQALLDACVALIPKGDGSSQLPQDQRPIVLMAVLLRAWASARASDILEQPSGQAGLGRLQLGCRLC